MLKTGAVFTGAAMLAPSVLNNSVYGRAKPQIPSYLKGYEDIYTTDPRKAAIEYFREAKFGLFIQKMFSQNHNVSFSFP